MKTFIAVLIAFAFLIGFTTSAYYYIDKTTNNLTAQTEKLEKSAQKKEWKQAEDSYNKLKSSWEKTSDIWTVLIDHMELDKINLSMVRLKSFMDTREYPEVMSELEELKLLLKHIPESEAMNFKNIL